MRRRSLSSQVLWALALLALVMGCDAPASPTAPSLSAPGPTLATLEVDPTVVGGQTARGTATLTGVAPSGGLAITLTADNPAVTVPALLTIPAGAMSATFEIATTPVTTTAEVTISAQMGGTRRSAPIRLRIDPASVRPTANYTVGFSGLRENRVAVTTYTESGFTIATVSADWVAITTYGNPQPSLQFFASGGMTKTGEVRITAGGSPFWLRSVDFYSSVTRIPYVIEGFLSSEPMFTVINVLGNTFGAFVRTPNPNADVPVDVLLIRLSNPITAPGGTNPMGVDNIVLNR